MRTSKKGEHGSLVVYADKITRAADHLHGLQQREPTGSAG